MESREAVIIGAGPAGLSAAIYARRSGLDVLVIEQGLAGGQVNQTAEVENYPGLRSSSGMDLAAAFRDHAEAFGAEMRETAVSTVTGDLKSGFTVATSGGDISAKVVIVASGSTLRRAEFDGEEQFVGRGVSYCAVCDGPLYRDADVVVVGGGESALEEAAFLARFARSVTLVHRRTEFRASSRAVERARALPNVKFELDRVVQSVSGGAMLERVVLRDVKSGATSELAAEGIFVFVGAVPNAPFLSRSLGIMRSEGGWILTDDCMETSTRGIFAAGDVREKYLRQVVTAAADGAIAGRAAYDRIYRPL